MWHKRWRTFRSVSCQLFVERQVRAKELTTQNRTPEWRGGHYSRRKLVHLSAPPHQAHVRVEACRCSPAGVPARWRKERPRCCPLQWGGPDDDRGSRRKPICAVRPTKVRKRRPICASVNTVWAPARPPWPPVLCQCDRSRSPPSFLNTKSLAPRRRAATDLERPLEDLSYVVGTRRRWSHTWPTAGRFPALACQTSARTKRTVSSADVRAHLRNPSGPASRGATSCSATNSTSPGTSV